MGYSGRSDELMDEDFGEYLRELRLKRHSYKNFSLIFAESSPPHQFTSSPVNL
jgi:hypothetical protein